MSVIMGSARMGENNKITGGSVGDQKQSSTPDYKGEVSMQEFYVHKKGWFVLRPKIEYAGKIAQNMIDACNNSLLGYDQSNRYGVIKYGIHTKIATECDCSSLVRACVKEATGIDPGDFNTETEMNVLMRTGIFETRIAYFVGMSLYAGDIIVTKVKGHTGIICYGNDRNTVNNPYAEPSNVNITSIKIAKAKGLKFYVVKGQSVKWLQWMLQKDGFNIGKCGIDGECGNDTVSAIMDAQRRYGLVVDGIAGHKTIEKLKLMVK